MIKRVRYIYIKVTNHWLRPVVFNLEEAGPTEVVNHLWKGGQKIFYVHSCITFALSEWVATLGRGPKRVENHWPRRFSQNNEWCLDPLHTILLYSRKFLKIHMWVAAKRETVIEEINIINPQQAKYFNRMFWLALEESFEIPLVKKFWLLLHISLEIVDEWLC